ncbi:MAG: hypothetical protein J7M21_04200, partial [Planctomycetes bacterium]|nr:hypothetical protein [Planctomycetota bacterium]
MATIQMPGVFSGIDTDTLVQASMAAQQTRLNRLKSQQTTWQNKLDALDNIESPINDLDDLVETLRDRDNLRHVTCSSSDASLLQVSASAGAVAGTHEVVIGQLASAEKEVHSGVTPTEAWTHSTGVASADDEYISADAISDSSGTDYKFVFQFAGESQVSVDLSS